MKTMNALRIPMLALAGAWWLASQPLSPAQPVTEAPPAGVAETRGDARDTPPGFVTVTNEIRLLEGNSLDPFFYTWVEKDGTFADRRGVFTIQDGVLRISGAQTGFLATRSAYGNYRLVAEFKWGTATWGKKKDLARNSGLCIHGVGQDQVWMKSIEIQIAEGQTGDVVVLGGASVSSGGISKQRSYDTFKRPGADKAENRLGFRSANDLEKPHGDWNTIEVLCLGSRLRVKINDQVAFDGGGASPSVGRIFLQSNGAEIFFRNLEIHPVKLDSTTDRL
jgi:hypothetical protein